jgi:hypothetical protein
MVLQATLVSPPIGIIESCGVTDPAAGLRAMKNTAKNPFIK